jgi:hypothetical protein
MEADPTIAVGLDVPVAGFSASAADSLLMYQFQVWTKFQVSLLNSIKIYMH